MQDHPTETVSVCQFNADITMFEIADERLVPQSLKMGRFDAIFTDHRCFLLPIKDASFWKGLDWVALGRLGGPLGVLIAHGTHAVAAGVRSIFKPQSTYSVSELDHLAVATGAEVIRYERIVKLEGHKKRRGMMKVLYFDPAEISVHIVTQDSAHGSSRSRCCVFTFTDSEKAVRDLFVRAGIPQELQIRSATS